MLQKIHCDLLDIYDINWVDIKDDQIECMLSTIQGMRLVEDKDDLYGFVGTEIVGHVLAGFFVIQFPTEFLSYKRDKTSIKQTTRPAERVFFMLLPEAGRVLLQNRRFQVLPIDMETVQIRFKTALSHVFQTCKVGPFVSLSPTATEVSKNDLLKVYESSKRVVKLTITDPVAEEIPEEFVYYNPQRDRNRIIRDSRLHDYPQLREIDLTAKKDSDLRTTHLGQDLVQATTDRTDFTMQFEDQESRRRVLRRLTKTKFEFYVDIDSEEVSKETIQQVLEVLDKEASLDINLPPSKPHDPQMSLF